MGALGEDRMGTDLLQALPLCLWGPISMRGSSQQRFVSCGSFPTGGYFSREQREDDRLKHCRPKVQLLEEAARLLIHSPTLLWKRVCCTVLRSDGERKRLLVVPKTKTDSVPELVHIHPMAGHFGAQNTFQRVRDHFHWPGLEGDTKRFGVPVSAHRSPASFPQPTPAAAHH